MSYLLLLLLSEVVCCEELETLTLGIVELTDNTALTATTTRRSPTEIFESTGTYSSKVPSNMFI